MSKSRGRKKSNKQKHLRTRQRRKTQVKKVVKKLKKMNLDKYPVARVSSLLRLMGIIGYVKIILHPGKTIIRLRPNESAEEVFSTRSQLSYKPQELNNTYQRASTPNNTMFYGSVVPEDIQEGEIDNARVTAALEASKMLRENIEKGTEKLTYSRWEVVCDIPLIAIVYSSDFAANSKTGNEMSKSYDAFLRDFPGLKNDSKLVTSFLADEFLKDKIRGDYDYLISAIFTEFVVKKGLAGVYYPSVRAGAKGYNVAISPEYVDKCLKLVVAGECSLYKNGLKTFVDNDTLAEIEDDSLPFAFSVIENPDLRLGVEAAKIKINLTD